MFLFLRNKCLKPFTDNSYHLHWNNKTQLGGGMLTKFTFTDVDMCGGLRF